MCFTSTTYTYSCAHLTTIDVSASHQTPKSPSLGQSRLSCTFCLGSSGPLPAALTETTILDDVCPDCREARTMVRGGFKGVPFLQVRNAVADRVADEMVREGWERYARLYWLLRGVEKVGEVVEAAEPAKHVREEAVEMAEVSEPVQEEKGLREGSSEKKVSEACTEVCAEVKEERISMIELRPAFKPAVWRLSVSASYTLTPTSRCASLLGTPCSPRTVPPPNSPKRASQTSEFVLRTIPLLSPSFRPQSAILSPSFRPHSAILSPTLSVCSSLHSNTARRHSSICLSFVSVSPSVASSATFGSRFDVQRGSKLPEALFEARMMGLVALAGGMARGRRGRM